MHFFLSNSSGIIAWPCPITHYSDSCFVDLPDVTLVYSKIVKVFLDVELGVRKALLIAE